MDEPDETNRFLADHAALLLSCHRRLVGRDLVPPAQDAAETARRLFHAPFAVLSHDDADDPVLNYVNRYAIALWESDWTSLTAMPSRLTAEPMHRTQRAEFLEATRARGFVEGYGGVRISATGGRFRIEAATIWSLTDAEGKPAGQAATFAHHDQV